MTSLARQLTVVSTTWSASWANDARRASHGAGRDNPAAPDTPDTLGTVLRSPGCDIFDRQGGNDSRQTPAGPGTGGGGGRSGAPPRAPAGAPRTTAAVSAEASPAQTDDSILTSCWGCGSDNRAMTAEPLGCELASQYRPAVRRLRGHTHGKPAATWA